MFVPLEVLVSSPCLNYLPVISYLLIDLIFESLDYQHGLTWNSLYSSKRLEFLIPLPPPE